jgi:hypothetical protein
MRILWQFFLFVRTDLYFVAVTYLNCKNLLIDTRAFLRNQLARHLTGPSVTGPSGGSIRHPAGRASSHSDLRGALSGGASLGVCHSVLGNHTCVRRLLGERGSRLSRWLLREPFRFPGCPDSLCLFPGPNHRWICVLGGRTHSPQRSLKWPRLIYALVHDCNPWTLPSRWWYWKLPRAPLRAQWIEELPGECAQICARTFNLSCDFELGGPWAGVTELFSELLSEIQHDRPDLIERHGFELVYLLPLLRRSDQHPQSKPDRHGAALRKNPQLSGRPGRAQYSRFNRSARRMEDGGPAP